MDWKAGSLDALVTGIIGARAVFDAINGEYVSMGAETIASAALAYSSYKSFIEDPYEKGWLIAGLSLLVSGTVRILYGFSENRVTPIASGFFDLAASGILLLAYSAPETT